MNIMTFCNPVSVAPPKLWCISLYKGTLTKLAFMQSKVGVLQLLGPEQHNLVPILGKRSGLERDYSKRSECKNLGYSWTQVEEQSNESLLKAFEDIDLLPGCSSYIFLWLCDEKVMDAGDHDVAICQVVGTGSWDDAKKKVIISGIDGSSESPRDETTALYTGYLRKVGIL